MTIDCSQLLWPYKGICWHWLGNRVIQLIAFATTLHRLMRGRVCFVVFLLHLYIIQIILICELIVGVCDCECVCARSRKLSTYWHTNGKHIVCTRIRCLYLPSDPWDVPQELQVAQSQNRFFSCFYLCLLLFCLLSFCYHSVTICLGFVSPWQLMRNQ